MNKMNRSCKKSRTIFLALALVIPMLLGAIPAESYAVETCSNIQNATPVLAAPWSQFVTPLPPAALGTVVLGDDVYHVTTNTTLSGQDAVCDLYAGNIVSEATAAITIPQGVHAVIWIDKDVTLDICRKRSP